MMPRPELPRYSATSCLVQRHLSPSSILLTVFGKGGLIRRGLSRRLKAEKLSSSCSALFKYLSPVFMHINGHFRKTFHLPRNAKRPHPCTNGLHGLRASPQEPLTFIVEFSTSVLCKFYISHYDVKRLQDRLRGSIEQRFASKTKGRLDNNLYMYWMRARNVPVFEPPFQKAILAYLSDLNM